jgi:phytoene dehydrogenase-like protein
MKTACVIGSGPNGLTAAIVLARAGLEVTVHEAQDTIGGGTRSAALTLPGFVHDVCSAVHPMAVSSAAFRQFPLAEHGLEWIYPPEPLAHPLDDGSAGTLSDIDIGVPLAKEWDALADDLLGPLRFPKHPWLYARFGMLAPWPASWEARALFRDPTARAVFAGIAAHSVLPLSSLFTSAVAWPLAIAGKAHGWPIPRGGSQSIANALASYLRSLGGRVVTSSPVTSPPDADLILADITPRQLIDIAGSKLPAAYRRKLSRYRYGPGVFKMDWALDGPIPWRAPACARTATVHIGGTLEEIERAEQAPWQGEHDPRPFVLLTQPSLFDPTRAPAGKHTAWAYCHVPNGSTLDMSEAIEAQVERFAPGFRSRILSRSAMNTAELQRHNANLQGGDIGGGAMTLSQFFLRPTASQYRTPVRGLYLCSSSTPPGGGVHGMCGYFAALRALADTG